MRRKIFPPKKHYILKAHSQVCNNFWPLNALKGDRKCLLFHLKSSFQKQTSRGVLGKSTKFTGKHLCQSLFFNKVAGLWHFSQNTSWRLPLNSRNNLLNITYSEQQKYSTRYKLLRIAEILKYFTPYNLLGIAEILYFV